MPDFASGQEARLHQFLDEFRSRVVGKLGDIAAALETQNEILRRLAPPPTNIVVEAKPPTDKVKEINDLLSSTAKPKVPQFPQKKNGR